MNPDFSPPAPLQRNDAHLWQSLKSLKVLLPNLVRNWPSVIPLLYSRGVWQGATHSNSTRMTRCFVFSEERVWVLNPPMRGEEKMTDSRISQWNINAPSLKIADAWHTKKSQIELPLIVKYKRNRQIDHIILSPTTDNF